MPYAIPYSRFSSGKQASGSSLERQQNLIGAWLTKHPAYQLFHEQYADLGRSGATGEHLKHGFGRLLDAVEVGKIKAGDVILIESIDRAGRLPELEMFQLIQKIISKGVSIVTLDDGATYDGQMAGTGQLWQLLGKVQQAYAYSETLSRRIRASYKSRRASAESGQAIKRRTPVWLESDGAMIPRLSPYVKQAFEDYAAGLGERRILHKLRGTEPEFQDLNPSTIKRWFRNKTAIGYWGDIPNVYPPVVSKELFYRVQTRMQEQKVTSSAPTKHLLSGLVVCGACGSNFTFKKHKHSAPTMNCSKRARLGDAGCENNKSIPSQVLDYIRACTSYPALIIAMSKTRLSESESEIISLQGQIEDARSSQRAIIGIISTQGSDQLLEEAYAELKEKINNLENRLSYLASQTEPENITYQDANELEWDLIDDDPMKLNSLLQLAGYKLQCNGPNIEVSQATYSPGWGYPKYMYKGVKRRLLTPEQEKSFEPNNEYVLHGLLDDGTLQEAWSIYVSNPQRHAKWLETNGIPCSAEF